MSETLEIFGNEYENVAGFKVVNANGDTLTYVLEGSSGGGYVIQDSNGNIILPSEGGGSAKYESYWMDAPEPNDDSIHVWICLDDPAHLTVNLYVKGTGTADFGDGTDPSALNTNTNYAIAHTYSSIGVYEIVATASEGGSISLPNNNRIVTIPDYTVTERHIIRRAYIPSIITDIGQYKFQDCYALEKLTIKASGTIGMYMCSANYCLRDIIIPEGITSIGMVAFQNTFSAKYVEIPSTCTSINNNSFNVCKAWEFHIKATTPPTLSNTNAFSGIQANAVIYVPYSSDHSILEAYKTATNWSTYASYMQEEVP